MGRDDGREGTKSKARKLVNINKEGRTGRKGVRSSKRRQNVGNKLRDTTTCEKRRREKNYAKSKSRAPS